MRDASARVGAVVFDLDGTLIDSTADIASATNFTLERHGLPRRSLPNPVPAQPRCSWPRSRAAEVARAVASRRNPLKGPVPLRSGASNWPGRTAEKP